MIPLNLDSLQNLLETKQLKPQLQKDTNQLYIVFTFNGREFPLFFRIYEGGQLLQMLTFIPCAIKKTAAGEAGRLLHYLNKELDLPGFGMDEKVGLVFYRIMLPASQGQVDGEVIASILDSARTICQTFAPAISTVAAGASTFEEVLAKVAQANQPNQPQQPRKPGP